MSEQLKKLRAERSSAQRRVIRAGEEAREAKGRATELERVAEGCKCMLDVIDSEIAELVNHLNGKA